MRIALIADVHFGPPTRHGGKLRKLGHLAPDLAREFVRRMNQEERPDLVVNLGDVVEDQSPAEDLDRYREFLRIMAELETEVWHLAGNHDLRNLRPEELRQAWQSDYGLHGSRDRGGYHFVSLSARHVTDETRRDLFIELPGELSAWLEEDLADTRLPTVVFLHHPLAEMDLRGNRWFERDPELCLVRGREAVRSILEASGKVVGVFSGHAHWNHLGLVRGIPYVTLQSLTENLEDDQPGRPARACAVVDLDPGRILVRVLGEEPARYEFEVPPEVRAWAAPPTR
jgi:3',5'-cyclic-AMP phosphodiesterase